MNRLIVTSTRGGRNISDIPISVHIEYIKGPAQHYARFVQLSEFDMYVDLNVSQKGDKKCAV